MVQLTISIDSDNGSAPSRRQAIAETNDGPVYWHIYASLVLIKTPSVMITDEESC